MSTPTLEVLPASEFEHDIFTPMEAAQILRVGRTTIYSLISAHQMRQENTDSPSLSARLH